MIRARLARARAVQREPFAGPPGVYASACLASRDVWGCCALTDGADAILRSAVTRLNLSALAYHRVLKIARTIGDLAVSAALRSPNPSAWLAR